MVDSDSGLPSLESLSIAVGEQFLGIRACFPHDYHRTYVHHPRMVRVTRTLKLDRAESPGTVHNPCMTGIVPCI
jgi:hypothetical protein